MPGLLRLDSFNQLERLGDQTDQFGIQFKRVLKWMEWGRTVSLAQGGLAYSV